MLRSQIAFALCDNFVEKYLESENSIFYHMLYRNLLFSDRIGLYIKVFS